MPNELLHAAKAAAAREGRSLKELLTEALRDRLDRSADVAPGEEAWRTVFGEATAR